MIVKKLYLFLFLFSSIYTQGLRTVHMEGTYDLDGDGLQEFATVEKGFLNNNSVSLVRYYEISEAGYQQMNWELKAPDGLLGNFVDVELGDLDGDGIPELITVSNLAEPNQNELLQPIAFYYSWDGEKFNETAGSVLNLSSDLNFVRAHNFSLIDYDGDMDQEIAVSLGSPLREIVILDINEEGDWKVVQTLKLNGMRSGIGAIYVSSIDWDRDGYDEIIALSPEGEILRTQPFYNLGGELVMGSSQETPIPGLDGLISTGITNSDWDKDGFEDLLLPFFNGDIVSLSLFEDFLSVEKLPIDGGPLSSIQLSDFNQDSHDDLLLISGDMNILSITYGTASGFSEESEYFTLEDESVKNAQVFYALPISSLGIYTGRVIAAGWDGEETALFITELGFGPEPDKPVVANSEREQEDVLDVFPFIAKDEILLPKIPKPLETMGQPLPEGILPKHVLTVNQSFAYTLPEEKEKEFYSFRWLQPPPKGMFFHYDSRSIRWVPDEMQLGAYKLSYHVEKKLGEEVVPTSSDQDSLITYKVIPNLEGDDERFWLYVNDPPLISSEPLGTEFVAGDLFYYKPLILDRNPDAKISLYLESKPSGMIINNNEAISWQTDSSHINVYEIRLTASDGFDRATQSFSLFARAGVKILSEANLDAEIDRPYRYKVDIWRPDLEHILKFDLAYSPDGMEIDNAGLITWTPGVTQIDTQKFMVKISHGVAVDSQGVSLYVNHPPVIEDAPLKMNVVSLGEEYRFKINITDPNNEDDLIYTALEMPEGMRMDPYGGMIVWEPTRENIDFSNLIIDVSDGRTSRLVEASFFVNAPIDIVSIPAMQGSVGNAYEYQVMTTDLNKGALLLYDEVVPLERVENFRIYSVQINDDIYIENIDRYITDWLNAPAVYLTDQGLIDSLSLEVSRLNLKKYVHSIFWESDRLNVIVEALDDKTVAIKDILWEFFQGNKGRPPKILARRMSSLKYTLTEFPDGMEVDEYTGIISWTPTQEQVDKQKVSYVVSDGYAKDEQSFEIYVNHQPIIVSNPPVGAMVGEVFKYSIQVEDKNKDADLLFTLLKGPLGMQISKRGKVVWIPKAAQINENSFSFQVSDGYTNDNQDGNIFVNINPTIISTPRPVALTGHHYKYRVVAEDLNKDRLAFKAVKLPKNSTFDRKTGTFSWKPRPNQRGPNDIILIARDERGAVTSHEFQIHVFEDPSARQMINTGWPLLVSFVGVVFAWGMAQI
jgi:hypothetical protein